VNDAVDGGELLHGGLNGEAHARFRRHVQSPVWTRAPVSRRVCNRLDNFPYRQATFRRLARFFPERSVYFPLPGLFTPAELLVSSSFDGFSHGVRMFLFGKRAIVPLKAASVETGWPDVNRDFRGGDFPAPRR